MSIVQLLQVSYEAQQADSVPRIGRSTNQPGAHEYMPFAQPHGADKPTSQMPSISVNFFNASSKVSEQAWQLMPEEQTEGRWWYEVLEKSQLKDQFKFWYAVLKVDDEPHVLAPLFLMRVPVSVVLPDWADAPVAAISKIMPGATTIPTLFVGSPCADEGQLGVKNGADLLVLINHLNNAIEKFARVNRADMVVWKDFREHLSELHSLRLAENYFSMTSFPGSMITVKPGVETLEGYLATLDSARRKRIKKKLAGSRKRGELHGSCIQNPDPKLLRQLFALFNQTYARGKTKFEQLNFSFFQEVAQSKTTWWVILRDPSTDEPVAFNLCFLLGGTVIQKFIGLNYSYDKDWFLYFRLWEESMRWALSHGATAVQSGQTGYSAKLELGYKLIPLTNFCHHFNPLVNKVGHHIAGKISWSSLDDDLAVYIKAHPELIPLAGSPSTPVKNSQAQQDLLESEAQSAGT